MSVRGGLATFFSRSLARVHPVMEIWKRHEGAGMLGGAPSLARWAGRFSSPMVHPRLRKSSLRWVCAISLCALLLLLRAVILYRAPLVLWLLWREWAAGLARVRFASRYLQIAPYELAPGPPLLQIIP